MDDRLRCDHECPYRTGTANPASAFQFTIKSLLAGIVALLVGGASAHHVALLETPTLGGVPCRYTMTGEVLYFSIGCVGATLAIASGLIWIHVFSLDTLFVRLGGICRTILLLLLAAPLGAIGGVIMLVVFEIAFFTGPFFDLTFCPKT